MTPTTYLTSAIDEILREAFPASEPGAAVIAVKDGETIFRKGYGMANLELGVPIEPDMVFRLGSITKQITAVAILMLGEQGLLKLDDPITRFLPDYPTHAHTITVEHLLTHTSGIASYTDLPEWQPVWRKDFTVHELIDFFKHKPMLFAPGTRMAYNNSGYHLLGAIIEQASGVTYEQFLQQRIFDPLGMRQTYYDMPTKLIPRRVSGYQRGPDGYTNAEYLSMTQPYAAGALASTVDDLAIWDAALYTEQLIPAKLLERAWTAYTLPGGESTHYGYGWALSEWQGQATVEHGGGIHGFATIGLRMPADRVYVALLSNNPGSQPLDLLALKIAGLLIGKPYHDPTPIPIERAELEGYAGSYQAEGDSEWVVTLEGEQLHAQRTGGPPEVLVPIGQHEFCIERMSLIRFVFTHSQGGALAGLEVWGRQGMFERAGWKPEVSSQ